MNRRFKVRILEKIKGLSLKRNYEVYDIYVKEIEDEEINELASKAKNPLELLKLQKKQEKEMEEALENMDKDDFEKLEFDKMRKGSINKPLNLLTFFLIANSHGKLFWVDATNCRICKRMKDLPF